MHDRHDPDLIAAYADGDLDGDASVVERQLAECAECQMEFELHGDLRAMLAGVPAVTMSDEERATLRSGVRAGLDQGAPVVQLAPRQSFTRRWMAIGSVAAAALAVVGVAGILTTGGGDDSATADTTAAIALEESARDGAETMSDEFATTGGAMESADTTESDTAATTMMATEETTAEDAAVAYMRYSDALEVTEDELRELVDTTLTGVSEAENPEELTAAWFNEFELPTPQCIGAVEEPIYAVLTAIVDGEPVEAMIIGDEGGGYRAVILTVDGCTPR